MARKLEGQILAARCVTVYGPSGAGKSSLLQASVFPALVERYDVRLVRVDAWPAGQDPTAWVAASLRAALGFDELADGEDAREALLKAARAAARSSARLLVIYLDQLEQLLVAERSIDETQPFFDCVEELLDLPLRSARVVLSLREDYLGRFRDRLRDLRRVMENGFRVGPLVVGELTEIAVRGAATGEPPQSWVEGEMRDLMMQVRVPGQAATEDAEAQSAYAQIICRALFRERAAGRVADATEAEAILRKYLSSTLAELGPLEQRAQALLEEHLVGSDGSRTLRTENELGKVLAPADLAAVLSQLESAAILRAEAHHGSRYFEIGHDWLARRVFEQRVERERTKEEARAREEQARQLALARAQQRRLRRVAAGSVAIASMVAAAAVVALIARSQAVAAQKDAEAARAAAESAKREAERQRDEADDLRLMTGYLALRSYGDSSSAMKLLAEVKKPEERSGWVEYANEAAEENALFVTLRGHRAALRSAVFSPDGQRVLTASDDHTARVFRADGEGQPVVLSAHQGAITSASFAPDSKADALRVLTTSADGTARIWTIRGAETTSIELHEKASNVTAGAWSPDGARVVVASAGVKSVAPAQPGKEAFFVRVHSAADGSLLGEMTDHKGTINAAVFVDNTRVVTASEDKTARLWDGVTNGKVTQIPGHKAPVTFVAVNRDRGLIVTASEDAKARVFTVGAGAELTPRATLEGHTRAVVHAAISDDGKWVATASADHTVRAWSVERPLEKGKVIVLDKLAGAGAFVAFRPGDANTLATASSDHFARIFRLDAPAEPIVLSGNAAPVASIAWNPSGDRVVTAAFDSNQSAAADHAARIYDAEAPGGAAPWAIDGHLQVAALAARGDAFVGAYDDASVRLLERRDATAPIVIKAGLNESWGLVSAVAASADGSRVALASLGKDAFGDTARGAANASAKPVRSLFIYDKGRWEEPKKRYEVNAAVRQLSWDNAGQSVIAALEDATAMVVRPDESGAPLILKGHAGWLTSASFSRDGQTIVTTSIDRTALLFSAKGDGQPLGRLEHPGVVYAAALDPTGQRVATAGADGKTRVFDVTTKSLIAEFDAKHGALHRVAWSEDGSRIAVASASGAIIVWSRLAWPLVHEPIPSVLKTDAPALALGFIDGGATIVVAAASHVHAWKLDTTQLRAELSTRNRDCLGIAERALYLNEAPEVARKGYSACEQARGRAVIADVAQPINSAQSIVARVVVWPASAEVEIDGQAVQRRDGFTEVWGKAGEKKKVRVVDGEWSTEVEVALDVSGAKPSVIDLDATRPSKGNGEREKTLGEGLEVFINPDKPVF